MIPFFLADAAATAAQAAPAVSTHAMSPMATFFCGFALLILFAWYIMSDGDRAKRIVGTVLIISLLAFCFQLVWPPFDGTGPDGNVLKDEKGNAVKPGRITLGLDLRGGTSFLIELVSEDAAGAGAPTISTDAVQQAIEAIRKRVDTLGVSEPVITPQGNNRILVQIPALATSQIDAAREQLQKVAKLEFRLVHPQSAQLLAGAIPWDAGFVRAPYVAKRGKDKEVQPPTEIVVRKKPDLTGDKVTGASAPFGPKGYEIDLTFNSEGAEQFGKLTTEYVHQQFAIMLDGEVISAPSINEPIPNGRAVISGSFTEQDARGLASALLNPLKTPVRILEEHTVSSTLGAASIKMGIYSGVGGLALVLLFVVVYYRFAGLVAVLGLVANIIVLFGVMAAFGFVLTLPGIAGVILTIGLAVDANVLIYERLREEMDAGKSIGVAINSAYDKAFTVIFDANATTLITAAILFWRASGPVKGFSVALIIGVIASVFSAMVVTRVIFAWALNGGWFKKITMLHIIPTGKNFNFLGRRRLWISISLAIILISGVCFWMRGEKNFGIDFKGGDVLVVSMEKPVSVEVVRESLASVNLGDAVIQKETTPGNIRELISVRSPGGTSARILQHLQTAMPDAGFQQDLQEHVGPTAGAELARGSAIAFGLAMLGILVYVTLRFEFSFAIGAIVALLHDVIITVGVFALFGRELSLIMVGAILTIAGYSINDTIVVFDRIREGLRAGRRGSVQDIMNASINETLSRTLLTSGCTFLSVAALFFFGGPVLHDFAFAILIGIVVGTYSSIFIASPIVLWWSGHKGQSLRNEMDRTGGADLGAPRLPA
ncbi:MAG TPA: protein translocase subunit SecD [Chthoniobacteraceae bacterium]|jgi:SecD/SecF fusion protein|nr:protein translocase subunit SecD [Chthoniobacteraceae bacterium]